MSAELTMADWQHAGLFLQRLTETFPRYEVSLCRRTGEPAFLVAIADGGRVETCEIARGWMVDSDARETTLYWLEDAWSKLGFISGD